MSARLASLLQVRLLLAVGAFLLPTVPASATEGAPVSPWEAIGAPCAAHEYDDVGACTTAPANTRSDALRGHFTPNEHSRSTATVSAGRSAAKARPPIAGGAPGTSIRIGDQQFGAKVGPHARAFGLDPARAADRARFREIVEDIATQPDRVVTGTFRGQGPGGVPGPVSFRIKGSDVVVATPADDFVTVLRGGINNPSVRKALGE